VLNGGCPLDLDPSAFPAGAATRTVFGKAEIVLLREADDRFRVECWRSFSDYVFGLLEAAARDASL
jgi:sarcosine oxidase subunit gamma